MNVKHKLIAGFAGIALMSWIAGVITFYDHLDYQSYRTLMVGFLFIVLMALGLGYYFSEIFSNLDKHLYERMLELGKKDRLVQEKLSSQERYAVSLAELELDALSGFKVDTLIDVACSLVSHALGIEYCNVLELTPDGKSLFLRGGIGWKSNMNNVKLSVGTESLAGYSIMSGQPVIIENMRTETRFHSLSPEENDIVSGMSFVIGKPDKPFGVLEAHSSKVRHFTVDEITFVQTVANVLGEAIKRRQIEEALIHAKDDAERANHAKTDFLMSMSHELRTPLNAVIGFSQIMKMGNTGELNEKQEHYLNNIIEAGNNLLRIVTRILDAVKLEEGTLKLYIERVFVRGVIDDVIENMKETASKHNIVFKTELDPELVFVEADRQKLGVVVFNLLENAVKFSKAEGGEVNITTKIEGNMARFSMSDTGIGIKKEDIEKLFRKFVQLDSGASRKYGGTGIGLAVSKQIVELHGGTMSVNSEFGVGSTFTFTLPMKSAK